MEVRSLSAIRGFVGPGSRFRTIGRGFTDPHARWDRVRDAVPLVFLMVLTLVSRIPFRAHSLKTVDSVLFALAMDRYNVAQARPHAPGYPVYVAFARVLQPLFGEANLTLVALSILFATASVGMLYLLVRQLGSRRAAFSAALLFSVAPVFFENSLFATSYAGEAFFSLAVAWVAWRLHHAPSFRFALVLGALFALAVGYRQSMLFFLAPLCGWAFWPALRDLKTGPKHLGAGAAAAVGVALLWFVPMVVASGGLAAYQEATAMQSRLAVFATTVFTHGAAVWYDLWPRFLLYVHWELVYVLPPLVALASVGFFARRRLLASSRTGVQGPALRAPVDGDLGDEGTGDNGPSWHGDAQHDEASRGTVSAGRSAVFLAFWVLPAVMFYLLVFNGWGEGPNGYVLIFLPAVYLVYGLVGDASLTRLQALLRAHRARTRDAPPTRAPLVALGLSLVLLLPAVPLAASWEEPSTEIREHDEWITNWDALEDLHPPGSTAILATYSWSFAKWYFPEYNLWGFWPIPYEDWDGPPFLTMESHQREDTVPFYEAHTIPFNESRHRIPEGIERIVLFDFQIAGENDGDRWLKDDVHVEEDTLPNGWRILFFRVDPERPIIEDYIEYDPDNEY